MKRLLCSITIILIIIFLGLFKFGIALYEYRGNADGTFVATIYSNPNETRYMKTYLAEIEGKRFIMYIKKSNAQFEIGDKIKFQGTYTKGEVQRNYKGFDYNLYLKTKKIYGIFQIKKAEKIGKQKSAKIIWKKSVNKTKDTIIKNFDNKLWKENSALLSGILIGETEKIPDKTLENFREASLTHVLAISGENFMYIILLLNATNKKLKRKRLGNIITILCILFFMELTGNTASVIRAGIMSIILISSKLLHRKYDFWTSLAFSTLVQIVYNPYSIFDLGLILSYGGVIGLVTFYDILQKRIKSKLVSGTVAANIVIIPIIMYNFNTISLSFLVSNILASILIEPITILGLISIAFRFKIIYIILNLMLSILNKVVEICAQLPFSQIYVPTPSILSIMMYYLILTLIVFNIKGNIKNLNKIIAVILTLMIIFNLNFQMIDISINDKLIINFIDVGQGDCTLIRAKGTSILIDSGGSVDGDYDVGKNIDLPYLLDRKIKKLNYIMISHFDADHCQGFMYILKNVKVENAIICEQAKYNKMYQEFLKITKEKNIKIIYVKNGNTLSIGKQNSKIQLKVLHPQDNLISNNSINNNAIVCKLIYKDFSMLFTGDIEKEAEELLITNNINLKSTILKVGHHGSKTSTTEEFLRKVSPKVALIGVGKNNKFGHPNDEVLDRLNNIGAQIYRTDKNGEITLVVDRNGKIKVKELIKMN